jgi:hypothetical protein
MEVATAEAVDEGNTGDLKMGKALGLRRCKRAAWFQPSASVARGSLDPILENNKVR